MTKFIHIKNKKKLAKIVKAEEERFGREFDLEKLKPLLTIEKSPEDERDWKAGDIYGDITGPISNSEVSGGFERSK